MSFRVLAAIRLKVSAETVWRKSKYLSHFQQALYQSLVLKIIGSSCFRILNLNAFEKNLLTHPNVPSQFPLISSLNAFALKLWSRLESLCSVIGRGERVQKHRCSLKQYCYICLLGFIAALRVRLCLCDTFGAGAFECIRSSVRAPDYWLKLSPTRLASYSAEL